MPKKFAPDDAYDPESDTVRVGRHDLERLLLEFRSLVSRQAPGSWEHMSDYDLSPETPRHLTLEHGDHPRLRTDPRPTPPHLTSTNHLIKHREEAHPHTPGPWNPASSGTTADAHP